MSYIIINYYFFLSLLYNNLVILSKSCGIEIL